MKGRNLPTLIQSIYIYATEINHGSMVYNVAVVLKTEINGRGDPLR